MKSDARAQLDAFEGQLLQQQRDRRRRTKYDEAELPPMPADPMVCRWCGGKLKQLIADDPTSLFCQSLCAPNDSAPYREQCFECRREFHTGKAHATTCYACDRQEVAARTAHQGSEYRRDAWREGYQARERGDR